MLLSSSRRQGGDSLTPRNAPPGLQKLLAQARARRHTAITEQVQAELEQLRGDRGRSQSAISQHAGAAAQLARAHEEARRARRARQKHVEALLWAAREHAVAPNPQPRDVGTWLRQAGDLANTMLRGLDVNEARERAFDANHSIAELDAEIASGEDRLKRVADEIVESALVVATTLTGAYLRRAVVLAALSTPSSSTRFRSRRYLRRGSPPRWRRGLSCRSATFDSWPRSCWRKPRWLNAGSDGTPSKRQGCAMRGSAGAPASRAQATRRAASHGAGDQRAPQSPVLPRSSSRRRRRRRRRGARQAGSTMRRPSRSRPPCSITPRSGHGRRACLVASAAAVATSLRRPSR